MKDPDRIVQVLLSRHGRTYPQEVGIRLTRNTPAPLFQTLCLSLLFSARIRASVAVSAMRALLEAGWTTAEHMASATRSSRIAVLNEAGYGRFDEKTSTMLGDAADLILQRYRGDLRRLRSAAGEDPTQERRKLEQLKGIGDVGVDIFFRDIQAVWPELYPFADSKSLEAAKALGLPQDSRKLAECVPRSDFPRLVSALTRTALAGDAARIRDEADERY